jgi:UDP-N-acetylmuramate dehydrogenase
MMAAKLAISNAVNSNLLSPNLSQHENAQSGNAQNEKRNNVNLELDPAQQVSEQKGACAVMIEPAKTLKGGHGPRQVRLAQFTTLGVGGPAELWVCHNFEELREATLEPYRILGGGSNLIVSDDGVRERVIRLAGEFSNADLEIESERAGPNGQTQVITGWVGAAKGIPRLLRQLQERGLSGLEGLVGVPAVIGGSVRMNAGTRFGWMDAALEVVEIFVDGQVKVFAPSELGFAYRHSEIPNGKLGAGIVTRVKLKLNPSSPEAVQHEMDKADEARKGQPHQRTFGCAWKNPAGQSAGQLVDQAGLKGARIGGAMISLEHGNFMVNAGNATAHDVLALLSQIEYNIGVPLEREVEIWDSKIPTSTPGATGSRSLGLPLGSSPKTSETTTPVRNAEGESL